MSKLEQLMVLTSAANNRDFDVLAKAMLEQHAKIHIEEKVGKPGKGAGRSWKSSSSWTRRDKGFRPTAHYSCTAKQKTVMKMKKMKLMMAKVLRMKKSKIQQARTT